MRGNEIVFHGCRTAQCENSPEPTTRTKTGFETWLQMWYQSFKPGWVPGPQPMLDQRCRKLS